MGSSVKKLFCIGLTLVYALTQVVLSSAAEANLWAERRRSAPSQKGNSNKSAYAALPASFRSHSPLPGTLLDQLPPLSTALSPYARLSRMDRTSQKRFSKKLETIINAIPLSHISIRDVYEPNNNSHEPVVLIQDVHLHSEAQSNIAFFLQNLITEQRLGAVGVEGAFETLDFTRFRAFPNKHVTKEVAQAFLKKNLLAAPSFVGITSPAELPSFIGIDDKEHYDKNVQAYLSSLKIKDRVARQLEKAKEKLKTDKVKIFSPALKAFDDVRLAHQKGDVGLGAYAKRLSQMSDFKNLKEEGLILNQFLEAYELECKLDFKRVDQERKWVIDHLTKSLTEDELRALVQQSLAYRTGQLSFGAYYQWIRGLCESHAIDLKRTPAFKDYIRYVLLADGIQGEKLFKNLRVLERKLQGELAKTPEEKTLAAQSEHLSLVEKLVKFELTPEEWREYKAFRDIYSPPLVGGGRGRGLMTSSLKNSRNANLYPLPTLSHKGRGNINLSSFESFYEQADLRSRKMVEKIPPSNTALVVGGFHTLLITQLLKNHNRPYIVASPKITKVTDESGSAYLSIFAREKTPLEKLFEGEKLSINPSGVNISDKSLDLYLRSELALNSTEIPRETGVTRIGKYILSIDSAKGIKLVNRRLSIVDSIRYRKLDSLPLTHTAILVKDRDFSYGLVGSVAQFDFEKPTGGLLYSLRDLLFLAYWHLIRPFLFWSADRSADVRATSYSRWIRFYNKWGFLIEDNFLYGSLAVYCVVISFSAPPVQIVEALRTAYTAAWIVFIVAHTIDYLIYRLLHYLWPSVVRAPPSAQNMVFALVIGLVSIGLGNLFRLDLVFLVPLPFLISTGFHGATNSLAAYMSPFARARRALRNKDLNRVRWGLERLAMLTARFPPDAFAYDPDLLYRSHLDWISNIIGYISHLDPSTRSAALDAWRSILSGPWVNTLHSAHGTALLYLMAQPPSWNESAQALRETATHPTAKRILSNAAQFLLHSTDEWPERELAVLETLSEVHPNLLALIFKTQNFIDLVSDFDLRARGASSQPLSAIDQGRWQTKEADLHKRGMLLAINKELMAGATKEQVGSLTRWLVGSTESVSDVILAGLAKILETEQGRLLFSGTALMRLAEFKITSKEPALSKVNDVIGSVIYPDVNRQNTTQNQWLMSLLILMIDNFGDISLKIFNSMSDLREKAKDFLEKNTGLDPELVPVLQSIDDEFMPIDTLDLLLGGLVVFSAVEESVDVNSLSAVMQSLERYIHLRKTRDEVARYIVRSFQHIDGPVAAGVQTLLEAFPRYTDTALALKEVNPEAPFQEGAILKVKDKDEKITETIQKINLRLMLVGLPNYKFRKEEALLKFKQEQNSSASTGGLLYSLRDLLFLAYWYLLRPLIFWNADRSSEARQASHDRWVEAYNDWGFLIENGLLYLSLAVYGLYLYFNTSGVELIEALRGAHNVAWIVFIAAHPLDFLIYRILHNFWPTAVRAPPSARNMLYALTIGLVSIGAGYLSVTLVIVISTGIHWALNHFLKRKKENVQDKMATLRNVVRTIAEKMGLAPPIDELVREVLSFDKEKSVAVGYQWHQRHQLELLKRDFKNFINETRIHHGEKKVVFYALGLGEVPREAEETIRVFVEVLRQTVDDPGAWQITFIGMDVEENAIIGAKRRFSVVMDEYRRMGINVDMRVAVADIFFIEDMAKVRDEIGGGLRGDYILQRNVTYPNSAAQAGVFDAGMETFHRPKILQIYISSRNLILALGKKAGRYIVEAVETRRPDGSKMSPTVFRLPGMSLITAKSLDKDLQVPEDDIENVWTGLHLITDPMAMGEPDLALLLNKIRRPGESQPPGSPPADEASGRATIPAGIAAAGFVWGTLRMAFAALMASKATRKRLGQAYKTGFDQGARWYIRHADAVESAGGMALAVAGTAVFLSRTFMRKLHYEEVVLVVALLAFSFAAAHAVMKSLAARYQVKPDWNAIVGLTIVHLVATFLTFFLYEGIYFRGFQQIFVVSLPPFWAFLVLASLVWFLVYLMHMATLRSQSNRRYQSPFSEGIDRDVSEVEPKEETREPLSSLRNFSKSSKWMFGPLLVPSLILALFVLIQPWLAWLISLVLAVCYYYLLEGFSPYGNDLSEASLKAGMNRQRDDIVFLLLLALGAIVVVYYPGFWDFVRDRSFNALEEKRLPFPIHVVSSTLIPSIFILLIWLHGVFLTVIGFLMFKQRPSGAPTSLFGFRGTAPARTIFTIRPTTFKPDWDVDDVVMGHTNAPAAITSMSINPYIAALLDSNRQHGYGRRLLRLLVLFSFYVLGVPRITSAFSQNRSNENLYNRLILIPASVSFLAVQLVSWFFGFSAVYAILLGFIISFSVIGVLSQWSVSRVQDPLASAFHAIKSSQAADDLIRALATVRWHIKYGHVAASLSREELQLIINLARENNRGNGRTNNDVQFEANLTLLHFLLQENAAKRLLAPAEIFNLKTLVFQNIVQRAARFELLAEREQFKARDVALFLQPVLEWCVTPEFVAFLNREENRPLWGHLSNHLLFFYEKTGLVYFNLVRTLKTIRQGIPAEEHLPPESRMIAHSGLQLWLDAQNLVVEEKAAPAPSLDDLDKSLQPESFSRPGSSSSLEQSVGVGQLQQQLGTAQEVRDRINPVIDQPSARGEVVLERNENGFKLTAHLDPSRYINQNPERYQKLLEAVGAVVNFSLARNVIERTKIQEANQHLKEALTVGYDYHDFRPNTLEDLFGGVESDYLSREARAYFLDPEQGLARLSKWIDSDFIQDVVVSMGNKSGGSVRLAKKVIPYLRHAHQFDTTDNSIVAWGTVRYFMSTYKFAKAVSEAREMGRIKVYSRRLKKWFLRQRNHISRLDDSRPFEVVDEAKAKTSDDFRRYVRAQLRTNPRNRKKVYVHYRAHNYQDRVFLQICRDGRFEIIYSSVQYSHIAGILVWQLQEFVTGHRNLRYQNGPWTFDWFVKPKYEHAHQLRHVKAFNQLLSDPRIKIISADEQRNPDGYQELVNNHFELGLVADWRGRIVGVRRVGDALVPLEQNQLELEVPAKRYLTWSYLDQPEISGTLTVLDQETELAALHSSPTESSMHFTAATWPLTVWITKKLYPELAEPGQEPALVKKASKDVAPWFEPLVTLAVFFILSGIGALVLYLFPVTWNLVPEALQVSLTQGPNFWTVVHLTAWASAIFGALFTLPHWSGVYESKGAQGPPVFRSFDGWFDRAVTLGKLFLLGQLFFAPFFIALGSLFFFDFNSDSLIELLFESTSAVVWAYWSHRRYNQSWADKWGWPRAMWGTPSKANHIKVSWAKKKLPLASDLTVIARSADSTSAWKAIDKHNHVWWVKIKPKEVLRNEAFGYLLAREAIPINIPDGGVISMDGLKIQVELVEPWNHLLHRQHIDPHHLDQYEILITRDAQSLTKGDLTQKNSSGLEEILVFLAFTGHTDIGLNSNSVSEVISGRKRTILFDLGSASYAGFGEEPEKFHFPPRLLLDNFDALDEERLLRAIKRAESIKPGTIVKLAHRAGIRTTRIKTEGIVRRLGRVREIVAGALRTLLPADIYSSVASDVLPLEVHTPNPHDVQHLLQMELTNSLWREFLLLLSVNPDFLDGLLKQSPAMLADYALDQNPYLVERINQIEAHVRSLLSQIPKVKKNNKIRAEGLNLRKRLRRASAVLKTIDISQSRFHQRLNEIADYVSTPSKGGAMIPQLYEWARSKGASDRSARRVWVPGIEDLLFGATQSLALYFLTRGAVVEWVVMLLTYGLISVLIQTPFGGSHYWFRSDRAPPPSLAAIIIVALIHVLLPLLPLLFISVDHPFFTVWLVISPVVMWLLHGQVVNVIFENKNPNRMGDNTRAQLEYLVRALTDQPAVKFEFDQVLLPADSQAAEAEARQAILHWLRVYNNSNRKTLERRLVFIAFSEKGFTQLQRNLTEDFGHLMEKGWIKILSNREAVLWLNKQEKIRSHRPSIRRQRLVLRDG